MNITAYTYRLGNITSYAYFFMKLQMMSKFFTFYKLARINIKTCNHTVNCLPQTKRPSNHQL
jgi:hypothetical protein